MVKRIVIMARGIVCGCALALCGSWLALSAQGPSRDPHIATPPALRDHIAVGDMLLRPEQYAELFGEATSRKQAYPFLFGARFGAWDAGVVPYELAPNFTEAERQRILSAMATWSRLAPVVFVPRTTQRGLLAITRDEVVNVASNCFSSVGQTGGRASSGRLNLGVTGCTGSRVILHELGHALGLLHENQRPDRDNYIAVDLGNVRELAHFAFQKYNFMPLVGPYDFASIMHYDHLQQAIDRTRSTIIPHPPYQSWLTTMGTLPEPSQTDHDVLALHYNALLRESDIRFPTESVKTRFERNDLLVALERLHAFYMSRIGLHRPQGLSIDGRPDFLGIAQWIFDIYLPARSGGFSTEGAFDIVIAAITRTDEWRQKNPGRTPLTPSSFRAVISFSRDEFLDVLNRLDRFYAAPEGLQRPNGLSISGGPDFLGIATWIFDIYLNQRLTGASPNAAWQLTENAIRATDEWRSKH